MPIDTHLFQLFLVAAVVLVLLPGPDSFLILSRGLFNGRLQGWIAALGTTTGNVVHAILAAIGVSAIIAASPWMFDALRIAGAAYLVLLGAKALHAAVTTWRRGHGPVACPVGPMGWRSIFVQAALTNLLNPKVILFYLAFVPQFVQPALGSVGLQTMVLGLTLAGMALVYHLVLAALAAGAARRVLQSHRFRAVLNAVAGLMFVGFAIRLFLTERRAV